MNSSRRAARSEQSLACYLPENLDALTYVPLGMEEAVENFRNRARKGIEAPAQESIGASDGRGVGKQVKIGVSERPSNLSE